MFWGMLLSTIGSSMVWPFLMIYVSERLSLPLTAAASLTAVNAAAGLFAAFFAGPVVDRAGRKWVMVISLLGMGVVYLIYTQAGSLWIFALLMAGAGLFNPLYRVGGDAMMADLIPPDQRADAYALLRMSNNVGIAVGPMVGGFLAATSYNFAFMAAAAGLSAYALLIALFARETLPQPAAEAAHPASVSPAAQPGITHKLRLWIEHSGGYGRVFADKPFVSFIAAFTMTQMCATMIWVLLSVHAKSQYGVPENLYGLIPATNAIMVVTLQALVTRQTKKHAPLPVLAAGTLIYAAACASVALGRGFWGFWASMIIMTIGELMLMPTSTTYTANLAPADMRGRYMSIYGLTWNAAYGIGPLLGGLLNDHIGPSATWYGGGLIGLAAFTAFLVLSGRARTREITQSPAS